MSERRARMRDDRTCWVCRQPFESPRSSAVYCSRACANRAHNLRKNFGMEIEEYHALEERHGGLCAACLEPLGDETPSIDHCHETGVVRGLTHGRCNTAIGFLGDDPEKAQQVAIYLSRRFDLRDLCAA
jgi:hypothetical protein